MRQMVKRLTVGFAAVLMLALLFSVNVFAATAAKGKCGAKLTWTLSDAGVLTVSGTGAMTAYDSVADVPWYAHRDAVKSVVIKKGVTSVAPYAFQQCGKLTKVTLPTTVKTIGTHAFSYCGALKSISIPSGVKTIGNRAFLSCKAL